MSNRRGWRWRVLEAYPDARCDKEFMGDKWVVLLWPKESTADVLGVGITAPMAWLDAWRRIQEKGGK